MKKIVLLIFLLGWGASLHAQETTTNNWYTVAASETILSFGNVKATGLETANIGRFTPFFNFGTQVHKDFGEKTGFYTGLMLRNVGIITDLNDSVRVKQRVYTLGIPVAIKFGDMKGYQGAIGIDNEFALNFKQKVFVNDEKSKTNIWFSDRTKIYLPSVFAEFKSKSGNYIRFKYYLTDFLEPANQKVNVAGVTYTPTQSTMMYVSLGYAIKSREFIKK
ncbi:hypothetical protein [Algoriphagus litoralis]|uniref:hypothetical protein n=1 Tax=Algoriphagus litoralis TaxID=2202829 RepID=UPI000DBAA297|nr:hypothetical protein [Algoriphagus litoralis]